MSENAQSVSELISTIKGVVEGSALLSGVTVEGEVSNTIRASSGHWYFTLKDANAQIRGVMWRGVAERQSVNPENGASLIAVGDITIYPQRGEKQIQVSGLRPVGIGDLYARLEQLRLKLTAEGLFDPERKQPLPELPVRIGIVTSQDAAAFQGPWPRPGTPLASACCGPMVTWTAPRCAAWFSLITRRRRHSKPSCIH